MKINYSFLLGIIFGIGFIMIGLINNKLTNGNYASGIAVFLMFIWGIGAWEFLTRDFKLKKKVRKQ